MGFSLKSIAHDVVKGLGDVGEGALSLIPGIGDAMAQEEANQTNVSEASKNRAFQERLSNTAYQRAMQDMKKAGLNPMLAFQQGGASVPSGAQATVSAAPRTRLGEMAVNSALQVNSQRLQAQDVQSRTEAQISQANLNSANATKVQAETIEATERARKVKLEQERLRQQVKQHQKFESYDSALGKGSKALEDVVDKIYENVSNSAKSAKDLKGFATEGWNQFTNKVKSYFTKDKK